MMHKIAAVSFLNTIPLIEHFRSVDSRDVHLIMALPSRVSTLLEQGQAQVGLVPVVQVLRGVAAGWLGASGIACEGPVDSVKLFTPGTPGALRRVLADRGSRSSVALLKILLAELYGVRPDFVEVEPTPETRLEAGDGLLVIGDRCFEFEAGEHGLRDHDLGEMWQRLTGLPFVFAAWALAPGPAAAWSAEQIEGLDSRLRRARRFGQERLSDLAAREAATGKRGVGGRATTAAIDEYFRRSLRFELGARELAGMKEFHRLCREHDLAPDHPFPPVFGS